MLTDEQLDCDVTFRQDNDEFFTGELRIYNETDVLDKDHPFIAIKE